MCRTLCLSLYQSLIPTLYFGMLLHSTAWSDSLWSCTELSVSSPVQGVSFGHMNFLCGRRARPLATLCNNHSCFYYRDQRACCLVRLFAHTSLNCVAHAADISHTYYLMCGIINAGVHFFSQLVLLCQEEKYIFLHFLTVSKTERAGGTGSYFPTQWGQRQAEESHWHRMSFFIIWIWR